MELVTGRLSRGEFEAEITAVANYLVAVGVHTVLVTYGSGCDFSQVDPLESVPVETANFAAFVAELDDCGAYLLGMSDLHFKAAKGELSFLLCEESDIHCYADDPATAADIRVRWAEQYPAAYEANRAARTWQSLRGGPWQPFGSSEG